MSETNKNIYKKIMQILISKDEIFRSYGKSMAVASTFEGYTLQYSVDGENWTQYAEQIPAGENLIVNDLVQGIYLQLVGNVNDNLIIRFN